MGNSGDSHAVLQLSVMSERVRAVMKARMHVGQTRLGCDTVRVGARNRVDHVGLQHPSAYL